VVEDRLEIALLNTSMNGNDRAGFSLSVILLN